MNRWQPSMRTMKMTSISTTLKATTVHIPYANVELSDPCIFAIQSRGGCAVPNDAPSDRYCSHLKVSTSSWLLIRTLGTLIFSHRSGRSVAYNTADHRCALRSHC